MSTDSNDPTGVPDPIGEPPDMTGAATPPPFPGAPVGAPVGSEVQPLNQPVVMAASGSGEHTRHWVWVVLGLLTLGLIVGIGAAAWLDSSSSESQALQDMQSITSGLTELNGQISTLNDGLEGAQDAASTITETLQADLIAAQAQIAELKTLTESAKADATTATAELKAEVSAELDAAAGDAATKLQEATAQLQQQIAALEARLTALEGRVPAAPGG